MGCFTILRGMILARPDEAAVHQNSYQLMSEFRDTYLSDKRGCTVLDVGSQSYGGQATYRELFQEYRYVGMDVAPGTNVDIVGYDGLDVYDVVISGQTLEHVNRPWDWLANLVQYFRDYICIIVPNTHREHRVPIDTYRVFPDGMLDLFDFAGILPVDVRKVGSDTIGIGTHPH